MPVLANAFQAVASKLAQDMQNGTRYSTDELPKGETVVHTDVVSDASEIGSQWHSNNTECAQSNVLCTILTTG
jgi:hypothetical protein